MKKELPTNIAWAAGILAVALGAAFARRMGLIGHESAVRVLAMNGLLVAYYGNRMPKSLARGACSRQANRVGGRAMALSGLVYAALFAFAPISLALTLGTGTLAAGMAATFTYCFWVRSAAKAV